MGVAKAALEASVRYLSEALGPEGIRVNAISAGPIRTLAAAGVNGFHQILNHVEAKAPLRRTITQEDVARSAVYLCSDLASGVSGEIHYVDGGYNVIGFSKRHLESPIKELFGNLAGLKSSQIQSLERLYRRRVPVAEFCSHELATRLVELSSDLRRQIGILVNRAGSVEYVIVGDEKGAGNPRTARLSAGQAGHARSAPDPHPPEKRTDHRRRHDRPFPAAA